MWIPKHKAWETTSPSLLRKWFLSSPIKFQRYFYLFTHEGLWTKFTSSFRTINWKMYPLSSLTKTSRVWSCVPQALRCHLHPRHSSDEHLILSKILLILWMWLNKWLCPEKTRIENSQVASIGATKENKYSVSWLNIFEDDEYDREEILWTNHQFHQKLR